MLGRAELLSYAAELYRIGQTYDQQIADQIADVRDRRIAIERVSKLVQPYWGEYRGLLDRALMDIARNAVRHYVQTYNISDIDIDATARAIVNNQYTTRYYGATLNQRLAVAERRLQRQIVQTASVGRDPSNLAGLFTKSFPFGAEVSFDKRLLQGTAVKIEQDVAKTLAREAQANLVRWKLAPTHRITCQCDQLAGAVNRDVVEWLRGQDIDVNPRGLYFVEELPPPPHPNCQCEFDFVTRREQTVAGPVRRAVTTIRNILNRLRGH